MSLLTLMAGMPKHKNKLTNHMSFIKPTLMAVMLKQKTCSIVHCTVLRISLLSLMAGMPKHKKNFH